MSVPGYTTEGPQADRVFMQWPKDVPRPTKAEWEAAEKRWNDETTEQYRNGYGGDFGFAFTFTLQSYNRLLWWHFFFPDQREACQTEFGEQMRKVLKG